jgi:putative peptide zinc metalloprotease protein
MIETREAGERTPVLALFASHSQMDVAAPLAGFVLHSKNGAAIRLSNNAFRLVEAVDQGVSFNALATAANRAGAETTAQDIERRYRSLRSALERVANQPFLRLPSGFWFARTLMNEGVVNRIGARLTAMFSPLVVVCVAIIVLLTADMARRIGLPSHFTDAQFLVGYVVFVLSLIFHELGHAAATVRGGGTPGDIGLALYLIYPAFYTDVNAIWSLSRWRRVVVDVAGAYFQLFAASLCLTAYVASDWPPFLLAFWMNVYSIVFSLNPILKFDAYWALADLLGVTNLAENSRRALRQSVLRALGNTTEPSPWPSGWLWLLCVYGALSLSVWCWFIVRLVPTVTHRIVIWVDVTRRLVTEVWFGGLPLFQDLRSFVVTSFMLGMFGLMIQRLMLNSRTLARDTSRLRRLSID